MSKKLKKTVYFSGFKKPGFFFEKTNPVGFWGFTGFLQVFFLFQCAVLDNKIFSY